MNPHNLIKKIERADNFTALIISIPDEEYYFFNKKVLLRAG